MTTIIHDTFTGAADTALPSHTPDLGAAWVRAEGVGDALELNGSGGVRTGDSDTNGADAGAVNDLIIGQADCWAELTFTDNGDIGSYYSIYLKSQYDPSDNSPWAINGNNYIIGRFFPATNLYDIGAFGSGSNNTFLDEAGFTSGTNVLRMEVTGTAIRLLINGVEKLTATATGVVASPGYAGFRMRPWSAVAPAVIEFSAGDNLVVIPPTPSFWTALVDTTETVE